ncbi:26 kDa periplasmic immunogenic protein precursor [Paenibacillus konkukensis]|uniref:26 kDa periplasmic immunogenic protein n=1 Tax=Paenibacillus konkukensis TaxID=2020716 RepID=A0ABY4RQL2_9BACL|nr:SIMPL domain-containing protein [Paenibacillus konkukensis]UQZ84071.1 26 kDa periplasmic immunogenic protein precursor [Paenibacillus konkukensis]
MKSTVKSKIIVGVAAVTLLTGLTYFTTAYPSGVAPAYAAQEDARNSISVSGQGEIKITPDVAYISLGVVTKADTANEAQAKNAESFQKLTSMLFDTYKLDQKDVKTSSFQVQPVYNYTDKEPVITGYSASQTVQVTYRDIDKIGTFLDAASGAGANQINGIQFDTEKRQDYEIQAIDSAMKNAEVKAKAIAKTAGKELKGIMNVAEGGTSGWPVVRQYSPMMMKADMASSAAGTSISPGELTITTSVTVQYEF